MTTEAKAKMTLVVEESTGVKRVKEDLEVSRSYKAVRKKTLQEKQRGCLIGIWIGKGLLRKPRCGGRIGGKKGGKVPKEALKMATMGDSLPLVFLLIFFAVCTLWFVPILQSR
ncbi:hypothetical protein Ancab_018208 [Ancistrocladus abbreviatus]